MTTNDTPRDPDIPTRDRGILSQADREFLWGLKELSDQSERDARYRIRNRTEDGLRDLRVLNNSLDESDREQVFEKLTPGDLVPVFEFLYKGISDNADDLDDATEFFEMIAGTGVRRALIELDPDHVIEEADVDITVDRRSPELEVLKERFEEGEESLAEFHYLLEHSDVRDTIDESEITLRSFQHLYDRGMLDGVSISAGDSDEKKEEIHPEDYDDPEDFIRDLKEALESE